MIDRLKIILRALNERGVPLPMARDPATGKSSVSLTMLVISFNVVFIGLIGKWSKRLDIDLQQALYWFGICASLYFSRKFTGNSDTKVVQLESTDKETK